MQCAIPNLKPLLLQADTESVHTLSTNARGFRMKENPNEEDTHVKLIAELYDKDPKTDKFLKVDINDGSIDWGDVKKPLCRLFCYYYTLNNAPSYHNAAESYRKCGKKFKKSKDYAQNAHFFRKNNPEIDVFIKNYEENQIKSDISSAADAIRRMKIIQATYNPKDLFESVEFNTEKGSFTTSQIKNLEDIPNDLAVAVIENIDFKGGVGKPVFILASKTKAQDDILKMDEKQKLADSASTDGYNVQTTAEIIKGKMTVQTTIIAGNQELAEQADCISTSSSDIPEED